MEVFHVIFMRTTMPKSVYPFWPKIVNGHFTTSAFNNSRLLLKLHNPLFQPEFFVCSLEIGGIAGSSYVARPADFVIPAWSAGIQVDCA
jgi:hypothetical protein